MAINARPTDVDWPEVYRRSELGAASAARANELAAAGAKQCRPLTLASEYAQPFRRQLWELLKKMWLAYWRSPNYNLTR